MKSDSQKCIIMIATIYENNRIDFTCLLTYCRMWLNVSPIAQAIVLIYRGYLLNEIRVKLKFISLVIIESINFIRNFFAIFYDHK